MTRKSGRRTAAANDVPQTLAAAQDLHRVLLETEAKIAGIDERARIDVATIRARAVEDLRPLAENAKTLLGRLQAYCEAHASDLTEGGKRKSFEWPAGQIGWRTTPPALRIPRGRDADIIDWLQACGLDLLLRVEVTIDKAAILAGWKEDEALRGGLATLGVCVTSREEFFVAQPRSLRAAALADSDGTPA